MRTVLELALLALFICDLIYIKSLHKIIKNYDFRIIHLRRQFYNASEKNNQKEI